MIEIILTLTMLAVITVSLSKIIGYLDNANLIIQARTQAQAYAQTAIETINVKRNDYFACNCSHDSCAGNICTRASDSQNCQLFPGYTSCWTEYPANLTGRTEYSINETDGNALINYSPAPVKLNNWNFRRKIIISNASRDAAGNLIFDGSGIPDKNSKLIEARVEYERNGDMHTVSVRSLLTAWQNI